MEDGSRLLDESCIGSQLLYACTDKTYALSINSKYFQKSLAIIIINKVQIVISSA